MQRIGGDAERGHARSFGNQTVSGTVRILRRRASTVTLAPPKEAGRLSVTVAAAGAPPVTRLGAIVSEESVTAFSGATITFIHRDDW